MELKRRELFGSAAALVAAVGIEKTMMGAQAEAQTGGAPAAGGGERIKQRLKEQRAAAQMHSLPSAVPGEEKLYDRKMQSPLVGFSPKSVIVSNDSPITPTTTPEARALIQGGFSAQALGPTFLSYGPMLAEGNTLIEEWESQIYGADGTLYNNQYLWILTFENDDVVAMHEYNDTQHAAITFGPLGHWPELKPPTAPRRQNQHGEVKGPALAPDEVEHLFPVEDKFDLDPRLLADVVPSGAAAPVKVEPGAEGNKALIRALRKAKATGNQAMVNSFYAKGFRHWIGGERPFGWDHIPLAQIYAPLVKHRKGPLTVWYGPMVADENRVFEQMDSFCRLDDGTVYNNWHAFVHEIRDGKIVQTREYHDPRHVWTVLGRWADWGATPVELRSRPRRSNLQGIATTIQYPTTSGPDLERWKPFAPLVG